MDRPTLAIVTWLWHDPGYRWNHMFRYGAAHVNALAAGVRRHLTLPHEFICITDDAYDIDPSIRIVPIWGDLGEMGGCYRRLKIFDPDTARSIGERIVSIDLDSVVVGNLDPLFDRDEEFIAWCGVRNAAPYCGSLFMFTSGACAEVWEEFDPQTSPGAASRYIGTDQAWIGHALPERPTWGKKDGVLSFKRDFRRSDLPGFAARLKKAGYRDEPKEGDRIVSFHGPVDPSIPSLRARYSWIDEHWNYHS